MTPDKDIQELFDSVNIPFADNDAFLNTLNQRLEKVEFIKETQDAQIRRYKVSVIYSLIVGLVVGAGSSVLVQKLPGVAIEKILSCIALLTGVASFMIARNLLEIRSILKGDPLPMTA